MCVLPVVLPCPVLNKGLDSPPWPFHFGPGAASVRWAEPLRHITEGVLNRFHVLPFTGLAIQNPDLSGGQTAFKWQLAEAFVVGETLAFCPTVTISHADGFG